MVALPIIIISLVQGFTEFLPISSQGHNILIAKYFNFTSVELRQMNIIVHFGSLIAIIIYNYRVIIRIFFSIKHFFRPDLDNHSLLLRSIIISTLPLFLSGYITASYLNQNFFESLKVIGITSIIFSILLYFIDTNCLTIKSIIRLDEKTAFIIGCFQSLAVIPGASRSGVVITGMRMLGFNRFDSQSYSNILAIPAILGAVFYSINNLESKGFQSFESINFESLALFFLSFIFSFIFIHFVLSWVRKRTFKIFVIYRILFGCFVLLYFYNIFN